MSYLCSGDLEISLLKKRLEETEKAMERIVLQMGAVTSRLSPLILAQAMEGPGATVFPENVLFNISVHTYLSITSF